MATIVQWKDLSERLCVLTIGDGQSGTSQLDAGAEPFVTDVQDDDDIFTPVRSGSGYVRVEVDEADDVSGLVGSSPLERPVVLNVGGVTRWKGFLSCESFTQAWDKGPLELELPVLSGLGVIGGLYPSSDLEDLGYINFAQFLCDMNAALGGIYANFYFSAVSEPQSTLKYQFRMANYATAVDKNTRHEVATYGEILEDVCKLFGWCAVEYADSLVLLTADVPETDMIRFTASQLEEYAAGSTSSPTSAIPYASAEVEIFGAGHNRSFLAGKKRVEVSGDLNEIDEVIWKMDLVEQCVFKGSETYRWGMSTYKVDKFGAYQSDGETMPNGNIQARNSLAGGSVDVDGNNVKFYNCKNDSTAYGGYASVESLYEVNTFGEVVSGSEEGVERLVVKGFDTSIHEFIRIWTNFYFTPSQNADIFVINGTVKEAEDSDDEFEVKDGDSYCRMVFMIVGDATYYYHSDSGWNTTPGSVIVKIMDGDICFFGHETERGAVFFSYIPAPSVSGEVVMALCGTKSDQYAEGDVWQAFENLSIKMTYKNAFRTGVKIVRGEYRGRVNEKVLFLNNGFSESWDSECGLTLAREAVPDSYGVVLDGNMALPASLYGNMWPEDALAERAQKYFSKGREKVQAVVKSEGAMLDPMKGYELVSGGRIYALVGQSVNWKTNEINGLFFEQSETEE